MPKLANNEMGGFTDAVRLTFADLKAIGNGGTKVIGTIPAGGAVEIVGALTTVPVVGTTSLSIGVGFSGTAADINIQVAETNKLYKQLLDILSTHTKQTIKKLEKDCDRDCYMSAEEAKTYGLIDSVISSKKV